MATPKDKVLYEKVKKMADEIYKKSSAYKSGYIVKKYKELGGEYIDDKKHGKGIETQSNSIYDGEWKDNQRNGKGKMTYLGGPFLYKSYEGDWKDGFEDGMGKRIWKDGSIYDGEWKKGKRDGMGKMTKFDGTINDGKWKDDKLIRSTKIRIKVQLNTGEELEITVLPNETVHRVMEIISQEIQRLREAGFHKKSIR
jgi:hypothetical protein